MNGYERFGRQILMALSYKVAESSGKGFKLSHGFFQIFQSTVIEREFNIAEFIHILSNNVTLEKIRVGFEKLYISMILAVVRYLNEVPRDDLFDLVCVWIVLYSDIVSELGFSGEVFLEKFREWDDGNTS